jgi:hypothetical protein
MMFSASSAFTVSITSVVSGSSVGLTHDLKLAVMAQPGGILDMAAIDHVAQRVHPPFKFALNPDTAHQLPVHCGGLLARPQISERGRATLGRHAIGDAAACAAEIEAEHEPGPLRRAAMVERVDAERTMQPDGVRRHPLDVVEARPPDQRAVAEHPQVFGSVVEACIQKLVPHGKSIPGQAAIRPHSTPQWSGHSSRNGTMLIH